MSKSRTPGTFRINKYLQRRDNLTVVVAKIWWWYRCQTNLTVVSLAKWFDGRRRGSHLNRRKLAATASGANANDWSEREGKRPHRRNIIHETQFFRGEHDCVPHYPPPYDSDPNGAPAHSVP